MIPAPFTLDTNVLVYCVQVGDRRQRAAVALVEAALLRGCPLPLQSLSEFFVAATRRRYLTGENAAAQVKRWLDLFPVILPPSASAVGQAIDAAASQRFSYWDALLVATAAEAGCTAVISEDMAPGAQLGGARVVPAFAGGAIAPEALALFALRSL